VLGDHCGVALALLDKGIDGLIWPALSFIAFWRASITVLASTAACVCMPPKRRPAATTKALEAAAAATL
jgi:hypothetical protein